MTPRILAAAGALTIVLVVAFNAILNARNSGPSTAPKRLSVLSQTRGEEVLAAEVLDNLVTIKLKNNHKETITAFAISFDDVAIKEDFAYSEVNLGIEPGDTFEKSYSFAAPSNSSELPSLHLLAVLLKDGTKDGDSRIAKEIRDERLGEKVQIFRMLKTLKQEDQFRKDLKQAKSDALAAMDTDEFQTRMALNELNPSQSDDQLSDDLRNGLQVGRQKMLKRLEVIEQLPADSRERGFNEFKERANKLLLRL